jgi:hypothetical protein
MEPEVLEGVADKSGYSREGVQNGLIATVLATLNFSTAQHRLFDEHLSRIQRWKGDQTLDEPPSIALLSLFSLGAENMHSGDGLAPHNFYRRLGQVAGLTIEQVEHLQKSYTYRTGGVPNSEGNRGVATAYSLGHTHIGLPMSQALVRRADRERFNDMFAAFHFAPRSFMSSFDMTRFLDEWFSRETCTASNLLRELWRGGLEAQERISEVACQCLQIWEGLSDTRHGTGHARAFGTIRLSASLSNFPQKKIQLSLVMSWSGEGPSQPHRVLNDSGDEIGSLDFAPIAPGWIGLASEDMLDFSSVLRGELILEAPEGDRRLHREPRRLVPMRHDDLLQTFVEVDRVQLGEECIVLCLQDFAPVVNDFLRKTARPGFHILEEFPGLPEEWVAFIKVQMITSIPSERFEGRLADLNMLQPVATSQLILQGGLSLPGNLRMWASADPPEILATVNTDDGVSVSIRCVRRLSSDETTQLDKSSTLPALTWDLGAERLSDGDYEITMNDGLSAKPMRREMLRLRSADSPALVIDHDLPPLVRDIDSDDYIFSARSVRTSNFIRGAWSTSSVIGSSSFDAPNDPPKWFSVRKKVGSTEDRVHSRLKIPHVKDGSCRMTGEHHWEIEPAMPGRAPKFQLGRCTQCETIRFFITTLRQSRVRRVLPTVNASPRFDVDQVSKASESHRVDNDLCFDAICHVGRGTIGSFERIVLQVEPTRLFVDTCIRNLETLGHIEVERSPTTLFPTAWQIVNPTFAEVVDGKFTYVGFRNQSIMQQLNHDVEAMGGSVSTLAMESAPARILLANLDTAVIEMIAGELSERFHLEFTVVPDASERMVARLSPLSQFRTALPQVSANAGADLRRWDPYVARFKPASDISRVGAYQVGGFGRRYLYRTEIDLEQMTARLGDARIVKYLAAQDENLPLAGYDEDAQLIWVPQGAELPGLYGRVACLSSGSLPKRDPEQDLLTYTKIPRNIGIALTHLLMS